MSLAKIQSSGTLLGVVAIGAISIALWRSPLYGAESPVVIAPPAVDSSKAAGAPQTAVLAGGCFWGVQGVATRLSRTLPTTTCQRSRISDAHFPISTLIGRS